MSRKRKHSDQYVLSDWSPYKEKANFIANLTTAMGDEMTIQRLTGTPLHFNYQRERPPAGLKNISNWLKQRAERKKQPGVHFNGIHPSSNAGHFVAVREYNGPILNSYQMGLQVPNKNGFCQTFAIMNFQGS